MQKINIIAVTCALLMSGCDQSNFNPAPIKPPKTSSYFYYDCDGSRIEHHLVTSIQENSIILKFPDSNKPVTVFCNNLKTIVS